MVLWMSVLLGIQPVQANTTDSVSANPAEIKDWCQQLSVRLQRMDTSSCLKHPYRVSSTRSVNNTIVPYLEMGDASNSDSMRVLVIGGIHGDEWTSISLVFDWLNWIPEGGAPNIHWRIVPLSNPDGFYAKPSTRTNANGVDLNRNFPTPDWSTTARRYWVTRTDMNPRRNPGPTGGSEPETQLMVQHIEQYKPHIILSLHAPYGLIDFDGPTNNAPLRFGLLPLRKLGVYPGSMGNYAGVHLNLPVVTVELENARQMPSVADTRRMWVDLLKWLSDFPIPKSN
jgi:protein MpaA